MNEDYTVRIEVDKHRVFLSFSHNGYQFQSIRIKDPLVEIPQIIRVLSDYLRDEVIPQELHKSAGVDATPGRDNGVVHMAYEAAKGATKEYCAWLCEIVANDIAAEAAMNLNGPGRKLQDAGMEAARRCARAIRNSGDPELSGR